jgi:hypothetical protein
VTVKGSARPITLYTFDIAEDEETIRVAEGLDPTIVLGKSGRAKREAELTARIKTVHEMEDEADLLLDTELVEAEKEALEELDAEACMFKRTAAIYDLKTTTTPEFMESWDAALRLYMHGSWDEAKPHFERCKELVPEDGPTATLMTYLERRNWSAPKGWTGARTQRSRQPLRVRTLRACALAARAPGRLVAHLARPHCVRLPTLCVAHRQACAS